MDRRNVLALAGLAGAVRAVSSGEAPAMEGETPLCIDYLRRVSTMFRRIRDEETDSLLEASYAIARTVRDGGACFCQWETGHSFDGDMFPDRWGEPDIFVMGYTMGEPPVEPEAGDLLLVSVLRKPLDDPREKGLFVIGGPTPWCGDTTDTHLLTEANRNLRIKPFADIWIETHIPTRGALMYLPGETTPLGPTSGAMGMATYWAMLADAVRILSRDGILVPVKGDEPALPENTPRTGTASPLAAGWLDTCIGQTVRIETELGTIRRMASVIADHILDGGRLHVYSRYHQALSAESLGKRGGLALINATHADDTDFDGEDGDCVIMGTYSPDDPVDIAMCRRFLDTGMTVMSIGPATRNWSVPGGQTVRSLTDVHLGHMCDTYGVYALPGYERRVCPTSGLMVNLMFWATMIELAEEILRRTGDTPAVLSTGAITGGGELRRLAVERARLRGY